MREDLPLVSYERSMNHNYMVLGKCDFFGTADDNNKDYRVRMLLENKIQGLLPITHRKVNGESKYYYEINSLQSLERMLEKSELRYRELRALLLGCINLFDKLEEYLLGGEQIIILPGFIYVDVERMEPQFVCYPDYTGDVRNSFVLFIDELLAHIDHTDEQAVMLGYQVYRYTRNPNYVLSEIRKFMECSSEYVSEKSSYYKTINNAKKSEPFCFEPENPIAEINSVRKDRKDLEENNNRFGLEEGNVYDEEENCKDQDRKHNDIKELIGGAFCVFAALSAGAVIVSARMFKLFALSAQQELYLYGAVAMALVAAALFFICYIKIVRQNNEMEALNDKEEDNIYEELICKDVVNNLTNKDIICNNKKKTPAYTEDTGETVCLEDETVEERVLRGRVNGKEVNVPLDCLPLTVGKHGGVSDFIINDNAVSKMHARFEEHDGKVYVCDLNSTNGTVHNGEVIAIHTPVPLESGDTLRFGRSCFTYC